MRRGYFEKPQKYIGLRVLPEVIVKKNVISEEKMLYQNGQQKHCGIYRKSRNFDRTEIVQFIILCLCSKDNCKKK